MKTENNNTLNTMKTENKNILQLIQSELKVPKGQYNSFGRYYYRSYEDILESVKPILAKYSLAIVIKDDVVHVADYVYVKAHVQLLNAKREIVYENVAFAREDHSRRGMDWAQITGAVSSCARKYALNGLFAIDDSKDADTDEYALVTGAERDEAPKPKQRDLSQRRECAKAWAAKRPKESLEKALALLKRGSIDELDNDELDALHQLMVERQ